jgi:hypothetical protein
MNRHIKIYLDILRFSKQQVFYSGLSRGLFLGGGGEDRGVGFLGLFGLRQKLALQIFWS